MERLKFQAVHAQDVAAAFAAAAVRPVRGAFNVAAEPPVDAAMLARVFSARQVGVPAAMLRALVATSWRLHLQPTPAEWLDLGLGVPVMDTARARTELGWAPRHDAESALRELIVGMRSGAGADTPPMSPLEPPARRVLTAMRALVVGPGRNG